MSAVTNEEAVNVAVERNKRSDGISGREDVRKKKFRRVNKACFRCREKKVKCDSNHPKCSACASSNELCSYENHIRKRGLPPGYIRLLETLWGCVLSTIPDSEETVVSLLVDRIAKRDGQWRSLMLKRWKFSTIFKEIIQLLPVIEPLLDRDAGSELAASEENEESPASHELSENLTTPWRVPETGHGNRDLSSGYPHDEFIGFNNLSTFDDSSQGE